MDIEKALKEQCMSNDVSYLDPLTSQKNFDILST